MDPICYSSSTNNNDNNESNPIDNLTLTNSLFEVYSMNQTFLSSLTFRLGIRYLYCHTSQICEHYLYFSDLRLYHTVTDSSNTYPKLNYMTKFTRKKCDICLLWSGQYIVYGDRLAITNPILYCQHCYHMLHYSINDELLYDDFVVFPYLHDMK